MLDLQQELQLQQFGWRLLRTALVVWFGCTADVAGSTDAQQHVVAQQQQHRSLQSGSGGGNGTLAILIIVSILFCLVWTPTLFRRCGFPSYRDRLDAEQAEADAIRAVLQAGDHMPDLFSGASAHHGMVTLEDRRDYIRNILVTKRVRKSDPTKEDQQPKELRERRKSDLYIHGSRTTAAATSSNSNNNSSMSAAALQVQSEDEEDGQKPKPKLEVEEEPDEERGEDSEEACPICLNEYAEGDEICWSHNRSCNHVFHRECILEWLLRHDDCPCCRHNFLSVDDNMTNPVDDQSWGNTNLFWSPLRIPPLPRIDADEEEFWNRIHEFRHFARRYLNGPYQPNGYGSSSALDYPPSYLTRTRPYPTSGLSIFQLEDPSPAYSLAIGRSSNRFTSFGLGDLEMPTTTTAIGGGLTAAAAAAATVSSGASSSPTDPGMNRASVVNAPRTESEDSSSAASSHSADDIPGADLTMLREDPPGRSSEPRATTSDEESGLVIASSESNRVVDDARDSPTQEHSTSLDVDTPPSPAAEISLNGSSAAEVASSSEASSRVAIGLDTEICQSDQVAEVPLSDAVALTASGHAPRTTTVDVVHEKARDDDALLATEV